MSRSSRCAFAIFTLLTMAALGEMHAAGTPQQTPLQTTLCEIVANPQKYDRVLVIFTAHYWSDGIEHSVLVDETKCKFGIDPNFIGKVEGEDRLGKAIYTDFGTEGKIISATWIGDFRWYPERRIKRALLIHEMKDLAVQCEKCPSLHYQDPIHLPEPPLPTLPFGNSASPSSHPD